MRNFLPRCVCMHLSVLQDERCRANGESSTAKKKGGEARVGHERHDSARRSVTLTKLATPRFRRVQGIMCQRPWGVWGVDEEGWVSGGTGGRVGEFEGSKK